MTSSGATVIIVAWRACRRVAVARRTVEARGCCVSAPYWRGSLKMAIYIGAGGRHWDRGLIKEYSVAVTDGGPGGSVGCPAKDAGVIGDS